MKIPQVVLSTLALAMMNIAVNNASAANNDLQLYMDSATKQIFAEPGDNRVPLGTFRAVEKAAEAVTAAPSTEPVLPVVRLAELETKQEAYTKQIADIAQGNTRSRWAESLQLRGYLQTR